MRLSQLKVMQPAVIQTLKSKNEQMPDPVLNRLHALGFVAGEPIKVVTKGLFGGDPLLVQIGFTRFALRRKEAERIYVSVGA